MCTTICERDLRLAGEHLQEAQSTPCDPAEEDLDESAHKSERTTKTCRQGSVVPYPLCTV